MNNYKLSLIAVLCFTFSDLVNAIPIDLSGWIAEGGSSDWQLQSGNDTVLQTVNGNPAVFYDPSATNVQGTALSGRLSVQTAGDDDFIGFVLGYNAGEIFSSSADFFLIDWKQGGSTVWGEGLAISRVTNGSNGDQPAPPGSYWNHTPGQVDLIARATTLGTTGWVDFTEYTFNIVFTSDLISVVVNGLQEISITPGDVAGLSSFADGAFGFYNYSQSQVLYAGITLVDCVAIPDALECQPGRVTPVPVPATLALFMLGLACLGWSIRRNVQSVWTNRSLS